MTESTEHHTGVPIGTRTFDDVEQAPDPVDEHLVDPLDVLTIAELDAGSRHLGTSLVQQVSTHGDRYERALGVVLWLHRRRTDRSTNPDELARAIGQLTFVEVSEQLTALARELGAAKVADDPLASRSG